MLMYQMILPFQQQYFLSQVVVFFTHHTFTANHPVLLQWQKFLAIKLWATCFHWNNSLPQHYVFTEKMDCVLKEDFSHHFLNCSITVMDVIVKIEPLHPVYSSHHLPDKQLMIVPNFDVNHLHGEPPEGMTHLQYLAK